MDIYDLEYLCLQFYGRYKLQLSDHIYAGSRNNTWSVFLIVKANYLLTNFSYNNKQFETYCLQLKSGNLPYYIRT